jgi:hypothetical protein
MPMGKTLEKAGTEADGSKSKDYCNLCYQNGKFIQPDMTAEQMQSFVKGKLKEMRMPGFLAGMFTKNIPKLKRWKKV